MQRSEYYISEKTDGVRYLLVSVASSNAISTSSTGDATVGTCVLVDRKMNCYAVQGGEALAAVFGIGTVLDGKQANLCTSLTI